MQKITFRLWASILLLVFATLACRLFDNHGGYPANPASEKQATSDDFIPSAENEAAKEDNSGREPDVSFETYTAEEEQTLVIYTIHGNEIDNPEFEEVPDDLIALQQDRTTQQEIWAYFSRLIPLENRLMLSTYVVMTDGMDNSMAAVEQNPESPDRWLLVVDIIDARNPKELAHTLIHEYGHLLSLNASQVKPDAALLADPENDDLYFDAVAACTYYFPGEGCSQPNSYINAFYNRFWTNLYDEWMRIDAILEDDAYYEALDAFYEKYQDQFINDYAVTNPEEDLAETWTYFVLEPKPEGNTIAEQKILFLYEYPELVALREEIVARMAALSGKN